MVDIEECPGGCGIWALVCAPKTYSDFCHRASNTDRDTKRKIIFYPIALFFVFCFIYIVTREDAHRYYDLDDNDYKRAPADNDMNYKEKNVTDNSDAESKDSEE